MALTGTLSVAPIFVKGSRVGPDTGSNRGQKMETGEREELSESETRAVLEEGVLEFRARERGNSCHKPAGKVPCLRLTLTQS